MSRLIAYPEPAFSGLGSHNQVAERNQQNRSTASPRMQRKWLDLFLAAPAHTSVVTHIQTSKQKLEASQRTHGQTEPTMRIIYVTRAYTVRYKMLLHFTIQANAIIRRYTFRFRYMHHNRIEINNTTSEHIHHLFPPCMCLALLQIGATRKTKSATRRRL